MYYADTEPEDTRVGWEAQKGINNEKQNQKMNPLRRMLDTLGVTMEELRSGSRERRISDARTLLAATMPITQAQIAVLLNCSQAAVSVMRKRHKQQIETNKKYKDKWIKILFL